MTIADDIADLRPALYRYALSLSSSRAAAEDLAQATVLHAIERQHLFQPGTKLRSWCFTILHHIRIDELRSERRRREPTTTCTMGFGHQYKTPHPGSWWARPTCDPEAHAMAREVVEAIRHLADWKRSVMTASVLGDTREEIAERCGIPTGTVASRLQRIREAVREAAP